MNTESVKTKIELLQKIESIDERINRIDKLLKKQIVFKSCQIGADGEYDVSIKEFITLYKIDTDFVDQQARDLLINTREVLYNIKHDTMIAYTKTIKVDPGL